MAYMKPGSPFLYDDVTGDLVGIKDSDGSEQLFVNKAQADARYNHASNYSSDRFDRNRAMVLPPIYNGGDITETLSAANAGTSIASPVLIAGNDPAIRFSGGRLDGPVLVSGATPYYTGGNVNGSTLDGSPGFYVDFYTDSPDYEIKYYTTGSGCGYRTATDGKNHSLTSTSLPVTSAIYRLRRQLTARRPHHVRVLMGGGFLGLTVGPNDTVWRANFPLWKKRWGSLGDSLSGGSNATLRIDAYQYTMADLLGWEPVVFGEASTGYTTVGTGGNGRDTFLNRVATDMAPQGLDVVTVWGGQNDPNNATLQAAASATFAALAQYIPSAPVYVFGQHYPSGAADSTRDAKDAMLSAAALANPNNVVRFTSKKAWITGTGNAGAPTGTGNADLYIASDALHFTTLGHIHEGYRQAQSIAAAL